MSVANQDIDATLEHLFRRESGRLISVLTRIFGPHNLELAEDVVQDTLITAMNTWKMGGIPDNPGGWLFRAAKNKAVDHIRREKRHRVYAKDLSYLLSSEYTLSSTIEQQVTRDRLEDDQLRMMFTCCHPSLPYECQVALILKTLCGFGVTEIARAFLSSTDTIEKRLYRSKQKLRDQQIEFEIPQDKEMEERLESVLMAIYLLFNEGYNSTRHDQLIRKDLMEESLRLGQLLLQHPSTRKSDVFALLALVCFNMARSDARLDAEGNILLLDKQDRKLWNRGLIQQGYQYIEESGEDDRITRYHIEAAIAAEYVSASSYEKTNWQNILYFYDLLYHMQPAAVIALNRAVVVSELQGPAAGISAIESIPAIEELKNYYLLPAILGDLHLKLGDKEKARHYFTEASGMTESAAEKKLLAEKMNW